MKRKIKEIRAYKNMTEYSDGIRSEYKYLANVKFRKLDKEENEYNERVQSSLELMSSFLKTDHSTINDNLINELIFNGVHGLIPYTDFITIIYTMRKLSINWKYDLSFIIGVVEFYKRLSYNNNFDAYLPLYKVMCDEECDSDKMFDYYTTQYENLDVSKFPFVFFNSDKMKKVSNMFLEKCAIEVTKENPDIKQESDSQITNNIVTYIAVLNAFDAYREDALSLKDFIDIFLKMRNYSENILSDLLNVKNGIDLTIGNDVIHHDPVKCDILKEFYYIMNTEISGLKGEEIFGLNSADYYNTKEYTKYYIDLKRYCDTIEDVTKAFDEYINDDNTFDNFIKKLLIFRNTDMDNAKFLSNLKILKYVIEVDTIRDSIKDEKMQKILKIIDDEIYKLDIIVNKKFALRSYNKEKYTNKIKSFKTFRIKI